MREQQTWHQDRHVAVIGAATCDSETAEQALQVGRGLARGHATILCGGRGGVMEAASKGARQAGGSVIGILPGRDAEESLPNPHVSTALFTGMGQARNLILVLSAGAVVAVGGGWGTLTEIAMALKHRIPVVALQSWSLARPDGADEPLLHYETSPAAAVQRALQLAGERFEPQTGDTP